MTEPELDAPPETWLVYGDKLQADGDPRGQLIGLQQSGEASAVAAYQEAHKGALFGSLAKYCHHFSVSWTHSVPTSLTVRFGSNLDPARLMEAVLHSPLRHGLRELRIVGLTPSLSDHIDLSGVVARVGELPGSLSSLHLIDDRASNARILVSADYTPGPNLVDFGSLEPVWFSNSIVSVVVRTADTEQLELGRMPVSHLRALSLLGLRWPREHAGRSDLVDTLLSADLSGLRSLALRLPEAMTYSWPDQTGAYHPVARYENLERGAEYGDDDGWGHPTDWWAELGDLFVSLVGGPLSALSLTGFTSAQPLLNALVASGLVDQLEHLDLSESSLGRAQVPTIRAHCGHLKSLDLRQTELWDAEPMPDLGPEVLHSIRSGPGYQFSVGME